MADGDLHLVIDSIGIEDFWDYPRAQALLAGGPLSVVSPLARDATLTLLRGDSYLDGRRLVFVLAAGDVWPADLTGWDVKLRVAAYDGTPVEFDGVVDTAVGEDRAVSVELSSADTAGLPAPPARYEVTVTSGEETVTLRHGQLEVRSF